MGYTTTFEGELKFTCEMKATELAALNDILGEDVREHREWNLDEAASDFYYIDLELTKDFSGIKWNGSEKSYSMEQQVNAVINLMKRIKPDFGLAGQMEAQGEEPRDRWVLRMENGQAVKCEMKIEGPIYRCPHCDREFVPA